MVGELFKTSVEIGQARRPGKMKEVALAAAVRSTEAGSWKCGLRHTKQRIGPCALLPLAMFGRPDFDNAGPGFEIVDMPVRPSGFAEVMFQTGSQAPFSPGTSDIGVAAGGKYEYPQPAHLQGGWLFQAQDQNVGSRLSEGFYPKHFLLRRRPAPQPRNW